MEGAGNDPLAGYRNCAMWIEKAPCVFLRFSEHTKIAYYAAGLGCFVSFCFLIKYEYRGTYNIPVRNSSITL